MTLLLVGCENMLAFRVYLVSEAKFNIVLKYI